MKRKLAWTVSLLFILALAACGTPAPSDSPSASPVEESTALGPQSQAPKVFNEADAVEAVKELTGNEALRSGGKQTYVTEEFYEVPLEETVETEPVAYVVTLDGEKIYRRYASTNMDQLTVSALYEVKPVDVMLELGPALDAFGWFQFGLSPAAQDIKTLDGMRERLESIFSKEIADSLMAQNVFTETENGLESRGGRGSDVTLGNAIIELTKSSDTERVYQVTAEYVKGGALYEVEETKVFTYVQTLQDGKWLFTTFQALYY